MQTSDVAKTLEVALRVSGCPKRQESGRPGGVQSRPTVQILGALLKVQTKRQLQ